MFASSSDATAHARLYLFLPISWRGAGALSRGGFGSLSRTAFLISSGICRKGCGTRLENLRLSSALRCGAGSETRRDGCIPLHGCGVALLLTRRWPRVPAPARAPLILPAGNTVRRYNGLKGRRVPAVCVHISLLQLAGLLHLQAGAPRI